MSTRAEKRRRERAARTVQSRRHTTIANTIHNDPLYALRVYLAGADDPGASDKDIVTAYTDLINAFAEADPSGPAQMVMGLVGSEIERVASERGITLPAVNETNARAGIGVELMASVHPKDTT